MISECDGWHSTNLVANLHSLEVCIIGKGKLIECLVLLALFEHPADSLLELRSILIVDLLKTRVVLACIATQILVQAHVRSNRFSRAD
jgi:hypothetical protein